MYIILSLDDVTLRRTLAESMVAEAVAQVFAGVKLGEVIHGLFCAKTVPPPARDA